MKHEEIQATKEMFENPNILGKSIQMQNATLTDTKNIIDQGKREVCTGMHSR